MIIWVALLLFIIILKPVIYSLKNSDDRSKKIYLWVTGLATTFIFGSRYATIYGRGDINNYYRLYHNIKDIPFSEIKYFNTNMEMGYIWFNKILSSIVPWDQFIVYAIGGICVGTMFYLIYKNCDDPLPPVIFYICLGTFTFELTGYRQGLAMTLLLLAIDVLKNNRKILYILIILLAFSIHSSAIIFLLLIFIRNLKVDVRIVILLIFIGLIGSSLVYPLLKLGSGIVGTDYSEVDYWGSEIAGLIPITMFLISLIFTFKDFYHNKFPAIHYNLLLLGLIVYLLRYVSLPFERVALYLTQYIVFVLPTFVTKEKTIYIASIVLAVALFLYRMTSYDYKFFF